MIEQIDKLILQNLVINEDFSRQVLPYLKSEYFEEKSDIEILKIVDHYISEKGSLPNRNILLIELREKELNDKVYETAKETIVEIFSGQPEKDVHWLVKQTENWCQNRAMYLAIVKSISIYDGTDKTMSSHAIPDMIKDALAISFETKIGTDWIDDADGRFDYYTSPENKIPFDIETLNEITFGGIAKKTLSIILGGVHVGKTLSLVNFAAGYARLGFNVLYFSMEMDENEIMHRIDANMLKTPMHEIRELGKDTFLNRIQLLKSKSYGKIKVIQYPTSLAHTGHFMTAIEELKMKMKWQPDVVMVDYLGIVASSRIKIGSTNSHFYLKSVAEELRAMAIKLNVAVWSAMQLTRTGMGSSDIEMTDTAESIGIPGVCDFMLAAHRNEEMDALGQIAFKQLKNRFRNKIYRPKFVLGVEFEQQLYYDVDDNHQDLIPTIPHVDTEITQEKFESKFRRKTHGKLVGIDLGDNDE